MLDRKKWKESYSGLINDSKEKRHSLTGMLFLKLRNERKNFNEIFNRF